MPPRRTDTETSSGEKKIDVDIDAAAAEARLRRKMDVRIVPAAAAIYLLCFLDRSNIGNARLLGHETGSSLVDSLHLTETQYLIALMVFFTAYTVFDAPSNMLLKTLRPSRWIAALMLAWGATTLALAGATSFAALVALRFLLGAAEAGLFPGLVYFLTFWYKPAERALRVALILASSTLAGAFGGAIAYGVGYLGGRDGRPAWRWLFLLEGVPSCAGALLVLLCFPDWPERARWLSDAERALAIARLRGVASKGDSKVTRTEIVATLKDVRLYAHHVAYLCVAVPISSLSLFTPTIVAGLGFSGLRAQLFTVPPYVCAYAATVLVALSADRTDARALHGAGAMLVAAGAFLGQALLPAEAFAARYGLLCGAACGVFAAVSPLLAWLAANVRGTGAVGLAIGMSVAFSGPGQVVGVWIYKPVEAPVYRTGHFTNFAILVFGAVIIFGLRLVYVRRNARLPEEGERKWAL